MRKCKRKHSNTLTQYVCRPKVVALRRLLRRLGQLLFLDLLHGLVGPLAAPFLGDLVTALVLGPVGSLLSCCQT